MRMLSGVTRYETSRVPEAYPVDPLTVMVPLLGVRIEPVINPVAVIERPEGRFVPVYEITARPLSEDAVS
jgi:hypothetical protein